MTELVSKDERFRHMDPISSGVVKDITKADLKLEMNEELYIPPDENRPAFYISASWSKDAGRDGSHNPFNIITYE